MSGYVIFLAASGVYFAHRQTTTRDYFLAGGSIPAWAAAISLLATALSAATFIGGPQQAYKGDLSYLSANFGSIIAVLIVAWFFIPRYYAEQATTVYSILEKRLGASARYAAGGVYLVGRVFASGARLYIAALPASLIVFGDMRLDHIVLGVVIMTAIGVCYSLVGGARSVIWTDVLQTAIFTGAALAAAVILLQRIPVGAAQIIEALSNPGAGAASKLTLIKSGLNGFGPSQTYTLITAFVGFSLLNLGAYGTDQDMAQRMLSCRSAVEGGKSAIGGILVGLPVTALFMIVGLLLFIFYQRPDLMGVAAPTHSPEGSREIFLTFIINEMPAGMRGLMLAGLTAAALSTINSGLNSMSATFVTDFYRRFRPHCDERHYVKIGLVGVVGFGLILGLFAVYSAQWQAARPETTLIDFALSVMVFAYSGLVAVYLTALFTKRGNSVSTIAALATGFIAVVVMQTQFSKIIAFPWQMTIAAGLAFGVAALGKRPGARQSPVSK